MMIHLTSSNEPLTISRPAVDTNNFADVMKYFIIIFSLLTSVLNAIIFLLISHSKENIIVFLLTTHFLVVEDERVRADVTDVSQCKKKNK